MSLRNWKRSSKDRTQDLRGASDPVCQNLIGEDVSESGCQEAIVLPVATGLAK